MDWGSKLDDFGRQLLKAIGADPDWLPTDHNPISEELKRNHQLVSDLEETYDFFSSKTCRAAMSRAAVICQMNVYDNNGGPDGDGKPKGLRRQWYAWYKVDFAQRLSKQLGEEEFNGTGWAGRMSQTYGWLVDNAGVTYRDLWVDDASRMMEQNWDVLFQGCHIILAVEKDSLFADFKAAGKALGARSLVSGKGKQSKAATEKLLREHFSWRPDHDPFTGEDPLIVLHISDHDFDGEAVIGPTFGNQPQRYTEHILEARVGIKPDHVDQDKWQDKWYEVKTHNAGYTKWAEEQGLFLAECLNGMCAHRWPAQGVNGEIWYNDGHECPICGTMTQLTIKAGKEIRDQPYGFEVEAMPTRSYYGLIVDALLQVLPFDYIIKRLREECTADAYSAAQTITDQVCQDNESYQALLKEFERLEKVKETFEIEMRDRLQGLGQPHVGDWEDDDDDPEPEEYRGWVQKANDWTGPWRPFSRADRTASLVGFLREDAIDEIDSFTNERIEW